MDQARASVTWRRRAQTLLLCLSLPLSAGRLAAQAVELQLREEGTRAPVAGAIVRLLGERGVVAQGLSNDQGRLVLRAPSAGTYRLKVDRIGWSGQTTDAFPLAAAETRRTELFMSSRRVELPMIEVRGRSRCEREGQGGPLAAALWDEIGKALTANVVTQRQRAVRLHVRGFIREADLKGVVLRQWTVASTLMRGQPFASLPPAALATIGFVQEERNDSITYAAPDAVLMLSEEFIGTHCFHAVQGTEGLLGLAFEPISGRPVVDVKGTLWVDRATSELRHLEYTYTGLPGLLARASLGGRLEFHRLPSGEWIVGYWYIRTPLLRETEVRGKGNVVHQVARLAGYTDIGGRADIASDDLGRVDRAILLGRVYDSAAGAGMPGAIVTVKGTPDSIVTDAAGGFSLAVTVSGDQVVAVTHPRSMLLREGSARPVLLSIGDTTRVDFTVSSVATFVRALCGATGRGRSGIVGMAWDLDGKPAQGHEVRIRWTAPGGGTREERREVRADGLFSFCDLPPDRTLPVLQVDRRRTLAELPVRLEWGAFQWVELKASQPMQPSHPPGAVVRPPRP